MYNLAAVQATPEGHPQLPGRLQGLAISYSHKYRRTWNLQDLEMSLAYGLVVVDTNPEKDSELPRSHHSKEDSDLPGCHHILAVSYRDRYNRTGDLQDLETAIKYGLEAIATSPEGHTDLPGQHHDLAVSYNNRYTRTGNLQDLETAIEYNVAAVVATPEGHPDLPGCQQGLAGSYSNRYTRTGNLQDLEAGINITWQQ
jgi:hypothetical protein